MVKRRRRKDNARAGSRDEVNIVKEGIRRKTFKLINHIVLIYGLFSLKKRGEF